jgi:hypothetical protein
MFELHVVLASIVMFNILELTIEIMPNFPTIAWIKWRAGGNGKV